MNITARLLAPAALLTLGSCATIISGTSQAVTIDSNVQGATVVIDGSSVGTTPYSGKVRRRRETVGMLRKDGYVAQSFTMTSSYNPVALLSIFWDYSTTDFLSGAVWEYSPSQYYIEMFPAEGDVSHLQERTVLKALAMTFHGDLKTELGAGHGQLLNVIQERFLSDRTMDELVRELRGLETLDAKGFGEAVADLYI